MADDISSSLTVERALFDDLYRRVHGPLLNRLQRMLRHRERAEDVAAAAFQTAWEKRDQYRGESSLAAWLYAIARNAALTHLREEAAHPTDALGTVKPERLAEPDGAAAGLEQADLQARVQDALRAVPAEARDVLLARYVEERSIREIAEEKRLPEGTVGSRLFSARQFLRQTWPDQRVTADMADDRAHHIAEDALKRLTEELQAGRSDALKAYLAAMGRFHRYSWANTLLIQSQRPTATRVAGYHTWRDMGRAVRRGEKGIVIYAPIVGKPQQDDALPQTDKARAPVVQGFRTAYVFDIEQTEGKPLPDFARTGGDPGLHLQRLKEVVAARGIGFAYFDPSEVTTRADGYSMGGQIKLRSGLEAAEEFSVLTHELAHEMLHHGADRGSLSKTVRETQAEAVAFVVSRGIGLETNRAASDYISLYNGDAKTLTESLHAIQRASSEILRGLLPNERDTEHGRSSGDSTTPSKSSEQLEFGVRQSEPPSPDVPPVPLDR